VAPCFGVLSVAQALPPGRGERGQRGPQGQPGRAMLGGLRRGTAEPTLRSRGTWLGVPGSPTPLWGSLFAQASGIAGTKQGAAGRGGCVPAMGAEGSVCHDVDRWGRGWGHAARRHRKAPAPGTTCSPLFLRSVGRPGDVHPPGSATERS